MPDVSNMCSFQVPRKEVPITLTVVMPTLHEETVADGVPTVRAITARWIPYASDGGVEGSSALTPEDTHCSLGGNQRCPSWVPYIALNIAMLCRVRPETECRGIIFFRRDISQRVLEKGHTNLSWQTLCFQMSEPTWNDWRQGYAI